MAPLNRVSKLTAASYLVFWLAFYATIGPSSSYWGQAIMTLSVVAIFIGIASLARGTVAAWRVPWGR